jgi:hypothetical protein
MKNGEQKWFYKQQTQRGSQNLPALFYQNVLGNFTQILVNERTSLKPFEWDIQL